MSAHEEMHSVTRNAVIVPPHTGSLFPEKNKIGEVRWRRATSVT